MEHNQEYNKYEKAKIEEPNLQLPKALLRVNTDPSSGELFYLKIFEDDTKKVQHLREAIAAGAQLGRNVYRIRNMELFKATGEDFKNIHQIHKASKATIGVLSDDETERHAHSFIDLVGTADQVKMAEELIIDQVLKTYTIPVFPVILMPPTIFELEMKIHVDKIPVLIGNNNSTIVGIEAVSGAWLQYDNRPPPGGEKWERIVSIYGPKSNVLTAASLVSSTIYELWEKESKTADEQIERLFKELIFGEKMEGSTTPTRDISDQVSELTIGKQKLQSGEGSSSSSSGSGQTEEQKQSKDVKGSEHQSKDETGQHEEDTQKATAGEKASQQHV